MADQIKLVKSMMQNGIGQLVRDLGLQGRRSGRVFSAKAPRREDAHGGSFVVWLSGPAAGAWKDYATGEAGDVIDLVAHVKSFSRKEVLAWANDRYGLGRLSDDQRKALADRQAVIATKQAKAAADAELATIDRARKTWFRAGPIFDGTPAYAYFAARAVPLADVPDLEPRTLRFEPAMEWWKGRVPTSAGSLPGPKFPAILSAMRDADGYMRAFHATFLARDGNDKAPVDKPKMMWPKTQGLVIRLTQGPSRLEPEAAAAAGVRGPVIVTEGIEDAFSFAVVNREARCWAAGSLAGLLSLPDHSCADSYLIARDNDWGKPQAEALFNRAIARLKRFGKPVLTVSSPRGKDMNDLIRGAA